MSIQDPISDMLTRIRNAYSVNKESVTFPNSKMKTAVLGILKENGYVEDYKEEDGKMTVTLSYQDQKPAIQNVKRISKPGRRFYAKKEEIPTVLSGHGIAVVSTSHGIMTGEEAKKENLGGEVICEVY